MGLGAAGIEVISTIIAAPIAITIEAAALDTGLMLNVASQTSKRLSMKAEKHEQIETLADAKLNTISYHISKSLIDNHISDEELLLILSELDKIKQMKEGIKSKINLEIDEEMKQSLIAKGRENTIASFQTMFGESHESSKKMNTFNNS